MKKNIIRVCVALVAVSIASLVGAAEKKKKKDDMNQSTTMASMPLYTAGCPDPCSFAVQSHDKKEVTDLIKQHAKTQHNMDLADADAEAMVKTADKPMNAMGKKKQ